jgi:hypothetical protein
MLTGHQKMGILGRLPAGTTARTETAGLVLERDGWAVVLTHADAAGNHSLAGPLDISRGIAVPTSDLRGEDFRNQVRAALFGIVRIRP